MLRMGPLPDASLLWSLGRVYLGQRGKFCSSVGFHGCLPIYASTVLGLFVETGCCLELLTKSSIMKGRIICGKKNKPPKLCIKFLIKKSPFKSDLAHPLPSVSFSMPFIKCFGDLGPAPLGVSCYRIYHAWQSAVVSEGCWAWG